MTRENLDHGQGGRRAAEAKRLLHQHRIEKLLVVDGDGRCVGLITVKDIEKSQLNPNASKDAQGRLRAAAATTVGDDGFERCRAADRCRRRPHRRRHRARPFAARSRRR
jgi:IMP dehydrogenase